VSVLTPRPWTRFHGARSLSPGAVKFVALALGLLAAMAAEAQPASRVSRVGFLGDGPRAERAPISIEPLRDGLRELGYVENQNVLIEERWSGGRSERLPGLAAELAGLNVDVIVTHGVRAIRAVQDATKVIPIVMAASPDPVGTGLIVSLARPGANTTGMTDQVAELGETEIQIIRDVVPRTRRVSILWNDSNPGARGTFEQTRVAAAKAGLDVTTVTVRHQDDLEAAVANAAAGKPDALIVIHDVLTTSHRAQVARLALKHELPSICASSPLRGRWRFDLLRSQSPRPLQASGGLRGPHLSGSEAGRYSSRATDGVSAQDQPQDGQGSRSDHSHSDPRSGRRSHRGIERDTWTDMVAEQTHAADGAQSAPQLIP